MQLFACPFCGLRPESEFRYAGDSGKPRPPRECSDSQWAQYLYLRANLRGAARELWVHAAGCGRWIEVTRDTATHALAGSEPMSR